jgi:hypothetical protein
VFTQYSTAKRLNLAERNGLHTGTLQAEGEAAYS